MHIAERAGRRSATHWKTATGVGLAVAVLVDATVVRAIQLPAATTGLGERNRYLPRPPRRLPRLELGGPRDASVAGLD